MKKLLLAFDGGGVHISSTAVWLDRLVKTGHINLSRIFSFSGTSAGSILAGALAKPNPLDTGEIMDLTGEVTSQIFGQKRVGWLPGWVNTVISSSRYKAGRLKEVLAHHLGGDQVRLGDCEKKIVVPAWDISGKLNTSKVAGPVFFHNHSPINKDRLEWPLYEVVAASCSAPTYFEPAHFRENVLCDGGIVENTSALANFAICRDKYRGGKVSAKEMSILSIGNGQKPHVQEQSLSGWKTPHMVRNLTASITQGGTELSKRVLTGICSDRFHRLEPNMPFVAGLDEHRKVGEIVQWAKGIDLTSTEAWCRGYFG